MPVHAIRVVHSREEMLQAVHFGALLCAFALQGMPQQVRQIYTNIGGARRQECSEGGALGAG